MWMLEKSAGDEVTFVAVYVDDKMGHSYEYANALANKVTLAMIAAQPRLAADELESCPRCHHPNKVGFTVCAWCKEPRR